MTTIEIDEQALNRPSTGSTSRPPWSPTSASSRPCWRATSPATWTTTTSSAFFRLANGIYGQRQGGHNQMVRIKAPLRGDHPGAAGPPGRHLRRYSRGWGHHHPPEHPVPLRAARAGSRADAGHRDGQHDHPRACSDTVRNVTGCHLAGRARTRCSTSALGRGDVPLLAPPDRQRLPASSDQLLGMRHRLRPGHVQRRRRHRREPHPRRRTTEAGLPGLRRRRPRRQPAPALALEEFTTARS